jgi:phosphate butyryltransferase
LGAVRSACDDGICEASLFGDETTIRELAQKNNIRLEGMDIIHQADPQSAVLGAAAMADSGQADVIMKGFLSTSTVLKGILDRRFNLRSGPTLSHVAVLEVPAYHKLLLMTDGGMMVKPNLQQKLDLLRNAALVAHALGISPVKIAVSAAVNSPVTGMPQAEEAATLVDMVRREPMADCDVAGPMSFDQATSADAARRLGVSNSVAGDADIFLAGSIEECNITAKSMIVFAGAIFSGVIVGAKVPVSLVSRTDPVIGKKTSIALACLVADYYQRMGGGR